MYGKFLQYEEVSMMTLRKNRFKLVTLVAVLLLAFSFVFSMKASADTNMPATDTENPLVHLESPESYINYLKNYDKEDAASFQIPEQRTKAAVNGAKEALEEFSKLSYEDQVKFLDYMKDPEKLLTETFEGNDPNLSFKEIEDKPSFTLFANSRTVSHTGVLTAMGINWTEYKIDGTYEYNSTQATKHLSTDAYVNRHLNPAVSTTKVGQSGYISGGKYYGSGTFNYKIGVVGTDWGVQIGTQIIKVTGGAKGKESGSFYRQ